MMTNLIIGIDVSKLSLDVCYLTKNKKGVVEKYDNRPISTLIAIYANISGDAYKQRAFTLDFSSFIRFFLNIDPLFSRDSREDGVIRTLHGTTLFKAKQPFFLVALPLIQLHWLFPQKICTWPLIF